jgi:SsrA-binding protein
MPEKRQPPTIKNRRAFHDYFVEETFEAGIVLVGTEVKSVRASKVSLQDAHCRIENSELWLYNMHISPYEQGNIWNVDPRRKRKLLMHKEEIRRLATRYEQKGLALIPIKIYFSRGHVKVEVGVCRGKKLYDKRQTIAERDAERQLQQAESQRWKE